MTNQEFIEQHQQKDKLLPILSKFKNGIELYRTDSFFRRCINVLMRDADPVYLIEDLYKISVELKDVISLYENYMRESNPNHTHLKGREDVINNGVPKTENIPNSPQQFLKDVNNAEYRIKEYNGLFQIQRKRVQTITTGVLWWKKSKEVITWEAVDKHGRFFTLFNGTPLNIKEAMQPFSTLELAKVKLNLIKEGAKYHY
jgi:hypothetical protein